tara:strand:+ start:399 stop:1124 length:726 start_codon:yes stop_codon:yes gene_type:complete
MFPFLLMAAISAGLAIYCEERAQGRHRAFYLLKPLTTLLILFAALCAGDSDPEYQRWICVGLALSMLGDIALMFEGDGWFMAGLSSFLVAHVLFVVAFALDGVALPALQYWIPAAGGSLFLLWLLPRTGKLLVPVVVYVLALTAMSLAAGTRLEIRGDTSALLALAGAIIFLVSDAALSVCQFGGAYRRAQFLILSTYFLAIGLIAASVQGSASTDASADVDVAFHDLYRTAGQMDRADLP